ncbi:MAG: hypothetical protein LHW57_03135 [Candidatus Cloacimonetes bacterium]|nr:hypothetical protein [Candidatus Cloacimonadota bacterium]
MKTRSLTFAVVLLLLAACATSAQNSTSEYGYLCLDGSMANREAWVDGYQLGVDISEEVNRVRLKAGSHALEIRSANRILLAEEVIMEAGQTIIITVP